MTHLSPRTLLSLLCLSAALWLSPASATGLTTAWPVNIGPLNPHLYTPNQMFAQSMVYEPLVRYQADGTVIPWLATHWRHSADGKTWIFTLRDGVQFSSGEPFTAQAAKANFDAVLANRKRHAWLELVNQIVAVNAIGDNQLEIVLKSAYYPLLQELALPRPFRFIAPSQFMQGGTMHGIRQPIGTGPWMVQSSRLNQDDVLVRNPHYWGAKPMLDKITINIIPDATSRAVALETGSVDMLYGNEGLLPLDTVERLRHDPQFNVRLSAPVETVMLALNSNRGATRLLAVREALNYAVDKKTLIASVLYNTQQPADTLFAPSVPYANLNLPARNYNPDKASALLDQAGWQRVPGKAIREKDHQPLVIELAFIGTDALSKSMAEVIQANARAVGVDLKLVGEEESSIYARQRDGRFGMIFTRTWGAPYDPHAFMSSMRVPSHADYQAQRGLADKPQIDAGISAILSTTDEQRRRALYREVLTRLHNDAVYLPISYVSQMSVASKKIAPVPFAPMASEIPFEQITLAK
ncbi:nickel ABC transporter, nickel/metallophore periplasmic binding protein [Shimwellia pseudoproteus]|uniref:nickel ABC transporter substrate-binding protein n=1 Tax=Shimwellia pseudoproteus TaxID=570012 RepID=UPI0018EB092C|nr:nickel ABC transporter substrate-binding protein [Shimwellia pseudoproteus]MBJ3816096.1 nickel ABC transporter, nickel/metallophore periplasmic binding protein [Shimwellia pseudoproteus]